MIAAIYARKSTEQNGLADEQKSVARQVEHAKAYAILKGWAVDDAHIYVDDGMSGAEFASRPAFVRLMAATAAKPRPPFQVLVMAEESRLGREQIEVSYALKTLVTSGVRIFLYMEDRERTIDSPIEKAMLALQTMADEMEREKSRLRTFDAMRRKAQAGHVTGGRCFGYANVDITGANGERSHVERRIDEAEAAVVRRIHELYAAGHGFATIAKTLNAEGATAPRAQQGRPKGWAPSSIREVLHRPLYRGVVMWNKTQKRDRWGQVRQHKRAESERITLDAPELRIVPTELAAAVDERMAAMHSRMLRLADGRLLGRPPGEGARYLLTGMAKCSACGGTFEALSRAHGRRRAYTYGCSVHRRKGECICANGLVVPMEAADAAVLEAVEDVLLNPAVVRRAFELAMEALAEDRSGERRAALEADLATVERAVSRLTAAIAEGGEMAPLVEALRTQDGRRQEIRATLAAMKAATPRKPAELRRQLERHLVDWRGLLRGNVAQGQQILRRLIVGRLTFTPHRDGYLFTGTGTMKPMLGGLVQKGASPTGFEPVLPA